MNKIIADSQYYKNREKTIIEASIIFIQKNGLHNVTMDKIISVLPYPKGTVYKHFCSKEDLILAISNCVLDKMKCFTDRSAKFQGASRECLMVNNMSYIIFILSNLSLFEIVQCSQNPAIYKKASAQRLAENTLFEKEINMRIYELVEQAIMKKQLVLPKHMNMEQVVFSIFSINYGVLSCVTKKCEFSKTHHDSAIKQQLFNQNNILFDALNWIPLTIEKDYKASLKLALSAIYPKEIALIDSDGLGFEFY